MQKRLTITRNICAVILIAYSILLISFDWQHGQAAVRPYFSDIPSSPFSFGINTLSFFLIWCCAFLFYLSTLYIEDKKLLICCLYVCTVFFYLGLDDRFMFHERISAITGRNDIWSILLAGVFFSLMVIYLFVRGKLSYQSIKYLFYASICFFLWFVFDVFLSITMPF